MRTSGSSNSCKGVLISLLLALMILSIFPFSVAAQASQAMAISQPDTSAYPKISLYFWPTDADGKFISNVTTDQVQVLENDRQVKLESLDLLEPGTHIIFAINEGPTLANSYAGKTRMDRMKEELISWAKSESITTLDDFSLVTNDGILKSMISTPADWVDTLTNYTPDLRQASPSMSTLGQAVTLVTSLPADDHKTRAILYITPLPTADQLTTIQDQAKKAAQANTRLFIWLIGPPAYSTENAAKTLQQTAADTGGSFFIFSGAETLPDLNTYFSPLSHEYQAAYQTSLQKSGTYTLQVKVNQKNFQTSSEKISFDLKAEAPNPIFLSPPSEISLSWEQTSDKKTWVVTPAQTAIKYMVEFPDGHTRAIASARLLVDGSLESEVTSAPLDELTWDLSKYTQTATHMVQISIEDTVGFTSSTIKIPIIVNVPPKPETTLQKILDKMDPVTVSILGFLILLAVGLTFYFRRAFMKKKFLLRKHSVEESDPVKQPVLDISPGFPEEEIKNTPPDWPRLPGGGKAPARLVPISAVNASTPFGHPIALPLQDTLFGSNSVRCDIVLNGPTIAAVHARIYTDAAKRFYIADYGSAAGTWINYAPVSTQGSQLQHGDLVNIGAYAFRFEEISPAGRPIQVTPFPNE